jgi:hypothetical protein
VRIGNSAVTSIGGYVGWSNISDGRVKKNIKSNVPGLAFINKLNPVTYNLDLDAADRIIQRPAPKTKDSKTIAPDAKELASCQAKEQVVYTGFIAQEVEKAAKELNYNFKGMERIFMQLADIILNQIITTTILPTAIMLKLTIKQIHPGLKSLR